MLTPATSALRARKAGRRTIALAWLPATRGLPLLTIAAILALAAAPATVTLGNGGDDFSGALIAATVIGGSAIGYFVEDPAGETLSASPITLARRRLVRLAAIGLGLAITLMLVTAMAASAVGGSLELADRAAELAAVAGVAAAAAGLVHRSGGAAAGPIGAVAGALSVLVVSSLAVRITSLPTLASPLHHDRWWIVAIAAAAVAAWTCRDPYRR